MASNIFIYDGPGADDGDREIIIHALRRSVKPGLYKVRNITPEEVICGTWREGAALFVMPGGFDRGFIRALGHDGAEMIRTYVWDGGSYLGLGAGSYYGCDFITFDKGGPLQVVGKRPLKFYPGNGKGPAYGPYSYDTESGARAAPVNFFHYPGPSHISTKIYFNGGNLFVPYDRQSSQNEISDDEDSVTASNIPMGKVDKVLGVFSCLPNQPASIVKCKAGDGAAVLSGVQLEFRSSDLDESNPYLAPIKKELQPYDTVNYNIWATVLKELGLTVIE